MTDHAEKKPEAPSLASKTAWSACGSVCRAGGSFLCGIVVARQLGPESFGSCAYLTWLVTTLAVLTNLGLPATLSRYLAEFGPKADESWKLAFQRRMLKIFLITLTFGCAVIFGLGEMYGTARYSVPLLALMVMFFALQGLGTFYLESLAGRQRFHIAAKINCLSSLLQVAGILIGSTLFNLEGALAGYALGWLLPACLCLRLLRRPMSEAVIDVAVVRRVRRFAFHVWLALIISELVWSRLEILFLEVYWDNETVAMFTVGLAIASLATQGTLLLGGALMPHFSFLIGSGDLEGARQTYVTATRLMAVMVFPCCLGCAAVAPALLPLLYGDAFSAAVPNAIVLLVFAAIATPATVGSAVVFAHERSGMIFYMGLLGGCLSLSAGFFIIPTHGAWGAVWARSLIQLTMLVLGTWYISSSLRFPVPLFAVGKTLLAGVACAGSAYLVLTLLPGKLGLLLAIFTGVLVYLASIPIFGLLTNEDKATLRGLLRIPSASSKRGAVRRLSTAEALK